MKKEKIFLYSYLFFLILLPAVFLFRQKISSDNILSRDEMCKIAAEGKTGGGSSSGMICSPYVYYCSTWSDPCPTKKNGELCIRCEGVNPVQGCVLGTCSDICNWEYVDCGRYIYGECNYKKCWGFPKEGTQCDFKDCG